MLHVPPISSALCKDNTNLTSPVDAGFISIKYFGVSGFNFWPVAVIFPVSTQKRTLFLSTAIKTYGMGHGCTAPRFPNTTTKWRSVVRPTFQPPRAQGKSAGTHWIGAHSGHSVVRNRRLSCPQTGNKSWFCGHPVRSPVNTETRVGEANGTVNLTYLYQWHAADLHEQYER